MLLADTQGQVVAGQLDPQIHLPATAKHAILDFIGRELSNWRDHPERPFQRAENRLTEHLTDYLNNAAHRSSGFDHIQFRTETGDEENANRTMDLAVKPLGAALLIEGRRSTIFDTILPIECKRLPTPAGSDRDHREYVFSAKKSTGGIQRFKEGHHAAAHNLAAMIGYIQQDNADLWVARLGEWINELVTARIPGWSSKDLPCIEQNDRMRKLTILTSKHARADHLSEIEVRHLWIEMH